jgi:hypothetical protein
VVKSDSTFAVVARLGRLAARQVIGASGDGDVMAAAGTPFVHGKYMIAGPRWRHRPRPVDGVQQEQPG